jgi:hypothetical protein
MAGNAVDQFGRVDVPGQGQRLFALQIEKRFGHPLRRDYPTEGFR